MGIFGKLFRKSEKIEISGSWTRDLWKERPLKVDLKPDLVAFFAQKRLPYLWPDDKEYISYVDSKDDPQEVLRVDWTLAYLHHPNPEVIAKMIHMIPELPPSSEAFGVTAELAYLLTHSNSKVRTEAAKAIWKRTDAGIKIVFNLLGSRGLLPSGIEPQDAKRATELLRDLCPTDRKKLFQQLVSETFDPNFLRR